jgi:hypothetical protein
MGEKRFSHLPGGRQVAAHAKTSPFVAGVAALTGQSVIGRR